MADAHKECQAHVAAVLREVNTVKYLTEALQQLGRAWRPEQVKCVSGRQLPSSAFDSDGRPLAMAGYIWRDIGEHTKRGDILLHEEALHSQADVERSLRHELIHAFDDARGFLDPSNCYHQACSEIRAARLSGDCFVAEEIRRGHFDLFTSGKRCVERRAGMAVERNPMCRGFGSRAVDAVMGRCYRDYEPFVAPLYHMGSWPSPHGPPAGAPTSGDA